MHEYLKLEVSQKSVSGPRDTILWKNQKPVRNNFMRRCRTNIVILKIYDIHAKKVRNLSVSCEKNRMIIEKFEKITAKFRFFNNHAIFFARFLWDYLIRNRRNNRTYRKSPIRRFVDSSSKKLVHITHDKNISEQNFSSHHWLISHLSSFNILF